MNYIEFSNKINIKYILSIIKELNIKSKSHINSNNTLIGISSGLFNINKTISYFERIPQDFCIKSIENSLIITNSKLSKYFSNCIIVEDPRYIFILLINALLNKNMINKIPSQFNTNNAVSKKAKIHSTAIVEENVIIEDNVTIREHCIIKSGTVIKKYSTIKEGTIIGTDGMSIYKTKENDIVKFPFIGSIIINQNVTIGSRCVISKGDLTHTIIDKNSTIGHLSNIGHDCKIGQNVWIALGTIIGGHTTISKNTSIGLNASIRDNISIGENVQIGMGSVVTKNISSNTTVVGNPAKITKINKNAGPNR